MRSFSLSSHLIMHRALIKALSREIKPQKTVVLFVVELFSLFDFFAPFAWAPPQPQTLPHAQPNFSCASRLFDTVRCNFVRLIKNFLFCPTYPNHPMKTKNNFSKVSHPVSNATMRSPSHLSPLPSHLTKLSHVSQVSQVSQLIPLIPLIPCFKIPV